MGDTGQAGLLLTHLIEAHVASILPRTPDGESALEEALDLSSSCRRDITAGSPTTTMGHVIHMMTQMSQNPMLLRALSMAKSSSSVKKGPKADNGDAASPTSFSSSSGGDLVWVCGAASQNAVRSIADSVWPPDSTDQVR